MKTTTCGLSLHLHLILIYLNFHNKLQHLFNFGMNANLLFGQVLFTASQRFWYVSYLSQLRQSLQVFRRQLGCHNLYASLIVSGGYM